MAGEFSLHGIFAFWQVGIVGLTTKSSTFFSTTVDCSQSCWSLPQRNRHELVNAE